MIINKRISKKTYSLRLASLQKFNTTNIESQPEINVHMPPAGKKFYSIYKVAVPAHSPFSSKTFSSTSQLAL